MDFEKISSQLRTLDSPEKLKIIALLAEEGKKSISDIARTLKIHFSTTHKYLVLLENAGLVHSKTVKEDRLKRYFYVNDFDIRLSPTAITAPSIHKKTTNLKVLFDNGKLEKLDATKIISKYLKIGLPIRVIHSVLERTLREAYDYITFSELIKSFHDNLKTYSTQINKTLQTRFLPNSAYFTRLHESNKQIIDLHCKGYVFISNLSTPMLKDFIHDIRGIIIHGVDGKKPENINQLYDQILCATNLVSKVCESTQALDSFNYAIAPLVNNLENLNKNTEAFLIELNKQEINVSINLDIGIPRFAKIVSPHYFYFPNAKSSKYTDFTKQANKIAEIICEIIQKHNLKNISVILKRWAPEIPRCKLDTYYIANMLPNWQDINAGYTLNSRLDIGWQGWTRTIRCGEIQKITINLPRIAAKSENFEDFIKKLKTILATIKEANETMAELSKGYFLRKRKTILPSEERKKWNYVPVEDCLYSIALYALNKTAEILSMPNDDCDELIKNILQKCNDYLAKYENISLRTELTDNVDKNVADRFATINKKIYDINCNEKCSTPSKLHKYLRGGHLFEIKNSDVNSLKDIDFGLVKITKN